MGSCCGNSHENTLADVQSDSGAMDEEFNNFKINKMMKAEQQRQDYKYKILLLGPGDSGKTTIIKQMRKINGNVDDMKGIDHTFSMVIKERIVEYMKILCQQSIKLGIEIDEKHNDLRDFFINNVSAPYVNYFNVENVNKIKTLWSDDGIKATLDRRSEYQIADNIEYFMNDRLDDISSDEYKVRFDDYLRIRLRTTGFNSQTFTKTVNGLEYDFVFIDVGGQRSERSKWMNMMHDDINAILYVIAISEYDLKCFEDEETLRLDEALNLFKTVLQNGFCDGKTVTLFFNKYDLFEKKLRDHQAKTIQDIYPNDWPKNMDPMNSKHVEEYMMNLIK